MPTISRLWEWGWARGMSHLIHICAGLGTGLEESDPMLASQLWSGGGRREVGQGRQPSGTQLRLGLGLTLTARSFCTFLLASMSHLLPRSRRSTPAEAFWEHKGRKSQVRSRSPSRLLVSRLFRRVFTSLMLFIQFWIFSKDFSSVMSYTRIMPCRMARVHHGALGPIPPPHPVSASCPFK